MVPALPVLNPELSVFEFRVPGLLNPELSVLEFQVPGLLNPDLSVLELQFLDYPFLEKL
jgi:hypothetical protein